MTPDSLFTVDDAAEFLKYNPQYVRRLVRQGKLKPARQIGRSYVFTRETLEAWQAARSAERQPEVTP